MNVFHPFSLVSVLPVSSLCESISEAFYVGEACLLSWMHKRVQKSAGVCSRGGKLKEERERENSCTRKERGEEISGKLERQISLNLG